MLAVLEVTAPIFALIFAGFMAPRLKLLPLNGVASINAFVFYFALPAMLFRIISQQSLASFNAPKFIIAYAVTGLLVFVFMAAVSRKVHGFKQGIVFGLNSAHGNVGYLGIALVTELAVHGGPSGNGLGNGILAPIVLVIMTDILVVIVLGIACLEWSAANDKQKDLRMLQDNESAGAGVFKADQRWKLLYKVPFGILKSPLVFSIVAGLIYVVLHEKLGVHMWDAADAFIRIMAAAAGPCALFAIGASIGDRHLNIDSEVLGLTVAKLLVHPILAALVLFIVFKIDKTTASIGVLAACLPAASNTFIIAERYGARSEPLAQSILVGTLISVASVTFFIWFLGLR
jgi:malonate transporter and related proteins